MRLDMSKLAQAQHLPGDNLPLDFTGAAEYGGHAGIQVARHGNQLEVNARKSDRLRWWQRACLLEFESRDTGRPRTELGHVFLQFGGQQLRQGTSRRRGL
jgi:hypothetical protein